MATKRVSCQACNWYRDEPEDCTDPGTCLNCGTDQLAEAPIDQAPPEPAPAAPVDDVAPAGETVEPVIQPPPAEPGAPA